MIKDLWRISKINIEELKKIRTSFRLEYKQDVFIFRKMYDTSYDNNTRYDIVKNREIVKSGNYDIINYFTQL